MLRRFAPWFFAAALWAAIATPALAGPQYTDPDKADADFAYQGEYTGSLKSDDSEIKLGVQIIALGKGKFRAVGYHGGLPGDGWDGSDKVEVEGELKDGTLEFKHEGIVSKVKDGALSVAVADKDLGALKKVLRESPTLGKKPPEGAIVLFDGKNTDAWEKAKMEKGLLAPEALSKQKFGSHQLHVEFLLPYAPEDRGQGRGNSGLYLQGRYEVQMLDSFGLKGEQNECGGIYSVAAPKVNMCYPPLSWQTYDVEYTAAEYKDGKLTKNPRITVKHNGVVIHDDVELPGERNTTAAPVGAGPEPGPVYLQDHGNPVRYRNVWVLESK